MKNAVKVLIFTVAFVAVAAGAIFGIIKFNRTDFTVSAGAKSGETVITSYNGNSVNIVVPEKIRGKKVVTIGESAFEKTNIKTLVVPETVKVIEKNAFSGCEKLESVTLGESVTAIEDSAFSGCTKLTKINFPATLNKIGEMVFFNCEALENIEIADGGNFIIDNGVVFSADKTEACFALTTADLSDYKFPSEVEKFSSMFFSGHDELTSFEMPENATAISDNMFVLCTSLKEVKLHDGVKRIGSSAFLGCSSLEELAVPKSVKSIGKYCFYVPNNKDDSKGENYNPNFKLIVEKNSVAYNYAKSNDIKYELAK